MAITNVPAHIANRIAARQSGGAKTALASAILFRSMEIIPAING